VNTAWLISRGPMVDLVFVFHHGRSDRLQGRLDVAHAQWLRQGPRMSRPKWAKKMKRRWHL
jgi:hypothetical protein